MFIGSHRFYLVNNPNKKKKRPINSNHRTNRMFYQFQFIKKTIVKKRNNFYYFYFGTLHLRWLIRILNFGQSEECIGITMMCDFFLVAYEQLFCFSQLFDGCTSLNIIIRLYIFTKYAYYEIIDTVRLFSKLSGHFWAICNVRV